MTPAQPPRGAEWITAVVSISGPKSQAAYTRTVGYSPSVGFVLTVIVDAEDWSGVTASKTRGADLREYLESRGSH